MHEWGLMVCTLSFLIPVLNTDMRVDQGERSNAIDFSTVLWMSTLRDGIRPWRESPSRWTGELFEDKSRGHQAWDWSETPSCSWSWTRNRRGKHCVRNLECPRKENERKSTWFLEVAINQIVNFVRGDGHFLAVSDVLHRRNWSW